MRIVFPDQHILPRLRDRITRPAPQTIQIRHVQIRQPRRERDDLLGRAFADQRQECIRRPRYPENIDFEFRHVILLQHVGGDVTDLLPCRRLPHARRVVVQDVQAAAGDFGRLLRGREQGGRVCDVGLEDVDVLQAVGGDFGFRLGFVAADESDYGPAFGGVVLDEAVAEATWRVGVLEWVGWERRGNVRAAPVIATDGILLLGSFVVLDRSIQSVTSIPTFRVCYRFVESILSQWYRRRPTSKHNTTLPNPTFSPLPKPPYIPPIPTHPHGPRSPPKPHY